ncbi:MAG: hypothetical protein RLZZ241_1490 [Bacteroidota bacterium]
MLLLVFFFFAHVSKVHNSGVSNLKLMLTFYLADIKCFAIRNTSRPFLG